MARRRAAALVSSLVVAGGVLVPTAASATDETATHQDGLRRVGYYTNWTAADPRGFLVKNLVTNGQARRLTLLNYAFANVNADGRCFQSNAEGEGDANADYQRTFSAAQSVDGRADRPGQPLAGNFNQIRKLKRLYPHLRTQISIGGWTFSNYFSDAVLTERARREFVASCVDLFIKGNLPRLDGDPHGGRGAGAGVFDGIDIDWEWPGSEGEEGNVVRPEDKQNFTLMLAEFRRQLDAYGRQTHKHYSLTAFLPADPAQLDNGYEVPKVFRIVDFATVQGYDMHGDWEETTNHQSALFAPAGEPQDPDFTVDRAVTALLDRGAPRSQVVMGVPFYGRGWTGVPPANAGLFQVATGGAAPGSSEPGYEDYRILVTLLGKGFKLYRDERAGFSWLFDGTTFWTYEDPVVVGWKARYVRQRHLGGAMVWSLDADDDSGALMRSLDRGLCG
jgi:chitinase